MLRKTLAAGVAAAALLCLSGAAHANFVANGSFENVFVGGKSYFANNVADWGGGYNLTFIDFPGTADDGSYLSVYGPFPATSPDGGNFVEADGDGPYRSAITQTLNGLTVGQAYKLTFYQAAGQQAGFTGPTTEQWAVSLDNVTQYSSLFSLPQGGVGPWQQQTMTFVAQATSQVLSFLAVGTPGGAPPISFLDGVDFSPAASVPEPATLTLLGLGAVGLVAARRRKRQG